MKLGVFLAQDSGVQVAREAERLGFAFALVPEGFKQDAPSLLGAVAARTSRIRLASGVMLVRRAVRSAACAYPGVPGGGAVGPVRAAGPT
jgi:alkanesulfonate monooxygenase SsuD/methylene tetrahydromethanopterin reductase-like flavin-dependent oxidoreductase (luciferase family)